MKVLLDECVPRQMKQFLTNHTAITVQEMGWSGINNGRLLALAEENSFDVFVTADKNISYQQSIKGRGLGLVELPTNVLPLLCGMAAAFASAIANVKPSQHIAVSFPQT